MFKTKDLYFAAFLLASGQTLKGHTQERGNTEFIFSHTNVLDKAVAAYTALSASVNPVAYANAIRTLKSVVVQNIYINENKYQSTIRKANTALVSR
jgi:nitrogen fixation protein FixH